MNATDVAYQQVLAAWISVGAAIVQAIGAVAAILVSIHLARSSARREREADEAASRRVEAADRAASERTLAAERAADARIERSKIDAHNILIERITSLGALAAEECQAEIEAAQRSCQSVTGRIQGGFTAKRLAELRELLPTLKQHATGIELMAAISDLQGEVQIRRTEGDGGPAYIDALKAKLDRIYERLLDIDRLRR